LNLPKVSHINTSKHSSNAFRLEKKKEDGDERKRITSERSSLTAQQNRVRCNHQYPRSPRPVKTAAQKAVSANGFLRAANAQQHIKSRTQAFKQRFEYAHCVMTLQTLVGRFTHPKQHRVQKATSRPASAR